MFRGSVGVGPASEPALKAWWPVRRRQRQRARQCLRDSTTDSGHLGDLPAGPRHRWPTFGHKVLPAKEQQRTDAIHRCHSQQFIGLVGRTHFRRTRRGASRGPAPAGMRGRFGRVPPFDPAARVKTRPPPHPESRARRLAGPYPDLLWPPQWGRALKCEGNIHAYPRPSFPRVPPGMRLIYPYNYP